MLLIEGAKRHEGFVIGSTIGVYDAIGETHPIVGLYTQAHITELHGRAVNRAQIFHNLAQKNTAQSGESEAIPLQRFIADFFVVE